LSRVYPVPCSGNSRQSRTGFFEYQQNVSFYREVSNCNLGRSRDRGGEAQGFGSCLQLFWGQPSGGAKTACGLSLARRQGQRPLVSGRICGDESVRGSYPYGQRGWFHPCAPGREHGVPLLPGARDSSYNFTVERIRPFRIIQPGMELGRWRNLSVIIGAGKLR
jgi:hypothetical protein